MLCLPGVSDKLHWNPPSPQSFSTHNCKKKSDTISVLQVSYTFDHITLTLLISLSLSLSSSSLAWRKLTLDSSHTLKNLYFESFTVPIIIRMKLRWSRPVTKTKILTVFSYSQPVTERTSIQELRYRVQLCRDFHTVLAKVSQFEY